MAVLTIILLYNGTFVEGRPQGVMHSQLKVKERKEKYADSAVWRQQCRTQKETATYSDRFFFLSIF